MKEQTAVEWLVQELHNLGYLVDMEDPLLQGRIDQAKGIEMDQIVDGINNIMFEEDTTYNSKNINLGKIYYIETYGEI